MSKTLPVLQDKTAAPPLSLPELHQGSLSWEELDCVLADLDDFTEVQGISARSGSREELTLSDIVQARDGFVDGNYHGLQIHYAFADELWVDTFLREATGAQLVRMSEQELQDSIAKSNSGTSNCR